MISGTCLAIYCPYKYLDISWEPIKHSYRIETETELSKLFQYLYLEKLFDATPTYQQTTGIKFHYLLFLSMPWREIRRNLRMIKQSLGKQVSPKPSPAQDNKDAKTV
jgi:hypothetical protein